MANKPKKPGFILHGDALPTIDMISDESAGRVFKSLIKMLNGGTPDLSQDRDAAICFRYLEAQYQRDLSAYSAKVEKLSANGRKGGNARAAKASKQKAKEQPVAYPEYPNGDPYAD